MIPFDFGSKSLTSNSVLSLRLQETPTNRELKREPTYRGHLALQADVPRNEQFGIHLTRRLTGMEKVCVLCFLLSSLSLR